MKSPIPAHTSSRAIVRMALVGAVAQRPRSRRAEILRGAAEVMSSAPTADGAEALASPHAARLRCSICTVSLALSLGFFALLFHDVTHAPHVAGGAAAPTARSSASTPLPNPARRGRMPSPSHPRRRRVRGKSIIRVRPPGLANATRGAYHRRPTRTRSGSALRRLAAVHGGPS